MNGVDFGLIGDPDEYANLRDLQALHSYVSPAQHVVQQLDGTFLASPMSETNGEKSFAEISLAMERLTSARNSKTVGAICGCVTRVINARTSHKLEYLQSKEASLTPWEGRSGFHYLAANSGRRGVGIYYESGKLGFLMMAGDDTPCHKEKADSLESFIKIATMKFGLRLQ